MGKHCSVRAKRGLAMLERAVELGYAPAEALLADCCETGYCVKQDSLKAEQLRLEATAQGYGFPQ